MKNKASSSAYLIVLATLAAVLLAGCGGGDGGGDGGSTPRDVCEGLSLAQTTAMPGTLVTLVGVTNVDADTFLEISGPLSSIDGGIGRSANGDFFFAAPLHPDLSGNVGTVDVSLNVSGKRCELGTLALDALPPASEDAADIALASLETLALQQNQSFGFDPTTFDRNTTTSPTEIMQAQLYFALLDPVSPTSITEQRAQLAALTTEERILIGRFFEGIGLQQLINEQITFYQGVTVTIEDTPTPLAGAPLGLVPRAKLSPLAAQIRSADSGAGSCTALFTGGVSRVTILGAAELSMALRVSEMGSDELARSASSQTSASILLAGVGLLGAPVVAMAGNAFLMVNNAGNQDLAYLLPSTISDIRMRLNVASPINEDYMDVPGQQPPRWLALATATSKGFNLQKRVLDAAFLATGLISVPDPVSVAITSTQFAADGAYPDDPSDSSCYSIPPFTWSNIAVTERQWLRQDPIVTGSAVTLSDPNLVTPVQTGTSNIFIDLDSAKFPCGGCILIADLDVEIAKKNVVFSRQLYRADTETSPVTITGSIQNSSVPESLILTISPGGVLIGDITNNGAGFSFQVGGTGDRNLFPLAVTVESTSTNLPPDTTNREATTDITLDAVVNITRLDQGCIGPGSDVQLSATVTGVASGDDLVMWSTLDAIQITDTGRNQISATAAAPGSYTITATSVTDATAEADYVVTVGRCDVELSVYTYTEVSIGSGTGAPACGLVTPPPLLSRTQETGALPVSSNVFRHADNFTSGGNIPINLSLEYALLSTFQEPLDDSCKTMATNELGSAIGTISSQPDSAVLDVNLDLAIEGSCETNIISTETQVCFGGGASTMVVASFVIEVNAQSAGPYVAEMDLLCDLNQLPGPTQMANMFVVSEAVDQNGQLMSPLQFMDFASVISLGSMPVACYDNTPTTQSVQRDFTLLPPPPGETYTAVIRYTLTPRPWATEIFDPNYSGNFAHTGSMRGTIGVRAR